ncbi:MAG TPA: alpha/beta fold hydrolase, partial [Terrimesophilobacter sp.]|uniref:alpha/beta hydrolase n=1 Tax=Terrimesophilobacter sp. TaxID=2906435 RepID=UPI002F91DDBF
MKARRARTYVLVGLGLGALAVGAAASWMVGSALIRPVNRSVPRPDGFQVRVVSIPGQGHALAGWWLDRGGSSPVVLLLHSIRSDRSSMVPRARLLADHGFSVLLIDLQGHGETPGRAVTLGWREAGDARAALGWLRAAAPSRRIGVIGCSLG